MKHLVLCAVVMLQMAGVVHGQSFLVPEKRWNVQLDYFMSKSMELFTFSGDTIINGLPYSKMWVSYDSMQTQVYAGAVRENGGQVYFAAPGLSEGLLYDFTLEPGDTVRIINYFCANQDFSVTVKTLDSVFYQGATLRRWHLEVVDPTFQVEVFTDQWIEGVGSICGPLYSMYNYCIVCPAWDLLCCYDHDSLIFMNPAANTCYQVTIGLDEPELVSTVKVFPNPAVDYLRIVMDGVQKKSHLELFNLQGQRVFGKGFTGELDINVSEFRRGVYLIRITDESGWLIQNERIVLH